MIAPTPDWLGTIDHTADIGIVVRASNVEMLFARCAWGMFHIIMDVSNVQPEECTELVVQAPDREALLVRWLSELNFIVQTDDKVFGRFDVLTCSPTHMEAKVWGEKIDRSRHDVHTEIKAVTYHALRIEQDNDGWEAQVLFDV